MTAEPSVFPQMLFSAPLLFFPFVLVDVSPEIWLSLFHLHTPPSGAECLNKPELVEDTDSKYIASQMSSKQFLNVYCALQFVKSPHFQQTTAPIINHVSLWQSKLASASASASASAAGCKIFFTCIQAGV